MSATASTLRLVGEEPTQTPAPAAVPPPPRPTTESRLKMIVESAPVSLAVIGPDGIVLAANRLALAIVGAERLVGGERHPLGRGDIVHIPAGIPHSYLVPEGKHVTSVLLKIPAR